MAQQALFADMTGNLYHSHSSTLPSDLLCLAAPIGFYGQERPGNAGCQGQPQAHGSGAKGRQEARNQGRQRVFSPNEMSPTSGGLLLVLVPPLNFLFTLGQVQFARPILQVSYERNNKHFIKLSCRLNEIIK